MDLQSVIRHSVRRAAGYASAFARRATAVMPLTRPTRCCRLRAPHRLYCTDVVQILPIGCHSPIAAASRCLHRPRAQATPPSLAWLWLPARLSSAAQRPRSGFWREGSRPLDAVRCPGVLVERRVALFRPTRLLSRALQWRQFRSVLELDAHRAGMELRVAADGRRCCPIGARLLIKGIRDVCRHESRH